VRDVTAVAAACRRLGLAQAEQGTTQLFSEQVNGLLIRLPGWHYPVACDLASGSLRYDNFNGAWGAQAELERFLQAYAVEKARIEARKRGHHIVEQTLANGSIKLTIQAGV
jgi:hypothetical protein